MFVLLSIFSCSKKTDYQDRLPENFFPVDEMTIGPEGRVFSVKTAHDLFNFTGVQEIVSKDSTVYRPKNRGDVIIGDWFSVGTSEKSIDIKVEPNIDSEERILRIQVQLPEFVMLKIIQQGK